MQLCEAEKERLRQSLASRKSFFGGSLSTARDSSATSYVPFELREQQNIKPAAKKQKLSQDAPARAVVKASALPDVKRCVDYSDFATLGLDSATSAGLSQSSTAASKPLLQDRVKPQNQPVPLQSNRRAPAQPQLHSHKAQPRSGSLPPTRTTVPTVAPRSLTPPANFARVSPQPSSRAGTLTAGPSRAATPSTATPRSWTPGLSRSSPTRKLPQSTVKPQAVKHTVSPQNRVKKGQTMRKFSVEPQALGGPTRSQRANMAWADAAAKMRNPNATARVKTPPMASGHPFKLAELPINSHDRSFIGGKTLAQKSGQARPHQASISPCALPNRKQEREATAKLEVKQRGSSLAGKDLSRLPEWQRTLLEKKYKAELRRQVQNEQEFEEDSDASSIGDFLEQDEASDWRQELKAITGYDPSKYKNETFDDRSMEADWKSIQAEERRSAKMGRSEDEKAELEELARQKAKAALKKKRRPKASFVYV